MPPQADAARAVPGQAVGPTSFRHAPALDGLRGIAVAAVVVYHLWPDVLPGGFIGVDVFFVLSGFLLSALMVREAESTGGFGIGRFFIRRVRRLLPATLLVLLGLAAYAVTWAQPAELERLREHSFGALTYTINWMFIVDGTTYTDVIVGASPLRHMWSLAIEEQFYIVLAIAMFVLVRVVSDRSTIRVRLGYGALGLAAVSALWMFVLSVAGASQARLYFGTDTRVHAMLLGVGLGALVGDRLLDARRDARRTAVLAPVPAVATATAGFGILVLFGLNATEDATWMFRGGFVIVAVASTLVIAGVLSSRPIDRVLSFGPLVGLGTISYGVYLWHWPVIVILDDDRIPAEGDVLALIQIAITLTLSIASYGLVEQPIRQGELGRAMGRTALLLAPASVFAVGTLVVFATMPPESDVDDDVVAQDADDPALADGELLQLAVIGDSVMHTLIGGDLGSVLEVVPWNQEQSSFDRSDVSITSIAKPGCSFLPGLIAFEAPGGHEVADLSPFCEDWRGDLRRAVARDVPTDVVMVMPTNDLEDREVDGEIVAFGSPAWDELLVGWVNEIVEISRGGGVDVVLVAPAPRIDPNWSTPQGEREARAAQIFRSIADTTPGTAFIDLGEFVGDDPAVRSDGLHYTDDGARVVAAWLTPQLEQIAG